MERLRGLDAAKRTLQCGRFYKLTTSDGISLRCWSILNGTNAHVIVAHGRGEFIEKYYEIISGLVGRGLSVTCFDWRGHGLSQRNPAAKGFCHVDDFALYFHDLDEVHHHVTSTFPCAEMIILAHSMGGHIALRWLRGKTNIRAVLVSPMLDIQLGSWRRAITFAARFMSAIGLASRPVPPADERGFANNDLTTDTDRYREQLEMLSECPSLLVGRPTWGWLNSAINSCREFESVAFFDKLQTEAMLLVYSSMDTVISVEAIERAITRLPRSESLRLADARHEIMRETDSILGQFWESFDNWCKKVPHTQNS